MWQIAAGCTLLLAGLAAGWLAHARFRPALPGAAAAPEPPLPGARDEATGLPDGPRFAAHVERTLRSDGRGCAVLLIEIDPPAGLAGTHGRLALEGLVRAAGGRLVRALRPGDVASRAGEKRFAVLLHDVRDANQAGCAAMRLREGLHRPYSVDAGEARITTTVGIALGDPAEHTAERLLAQAVAALRRAGVRGPGASSVYETA